MLLSTTVPDGAQHSRARLGSRRRPCKGRSCLQRQTGCRNPGPLPAGQGLGVLDGAFDALPEWARAPAQHAVTMTGELSALFENRSKGVEALTDWAVRHCRGEVTIYGGRAGFLSPERVAVHAGDVASANWHATAAFVASRLPDPC